MVPVRLAIPALLIIAASVGAQPFGPPAGKTEVTLLNSEVEGAAESSVELQFHFKLPKGVYIDRANVSVESVPKDAWKLTSMVTPRGTTKSVGGVSTEVLTTDFDATTQLEIPGDATAGKQTVTLKLFYVTCTGNVCLPHNQNFEVALTVTEGQATAPPPAQDSAPPQQPHENESTPTDAVQTPATTASPSSEAAPAESLTFLERLAKYLIDSLNRGSYGPALAAAFLGGILLALTPCVLPMIPIVVKVLVGGQDATKGRRVFSALVYTVGLSLIYATLGLIAGLSGGVVGAVLQNRWVLGGFALFFGVLALSMFGLFELQVPTSIQSKLSYRSRGDLIGAFIMGMISGLIASPCIGPVILFVLTWIASTKNGTLGFIVLFTMGVGLGSPFIAAAFVGGRVLKPGNWMIGVKKFLGVLLLIGSAYFINLAAEWAGLLAAIGLWAIVGIVSMRWLTRVEHGSLQHEKAVGTVQNCLWGVLATLAFGVGFNGFPGENAQVLAPIDGEAVMEWRHDYDAALADAKAQQKPAMIYFTADWCLPCKELKHTAWVDPTIVNESKRFINIVVDITHLDDPQVEELRKKYFSVNGPPIVFFHDSSGNLIEKSITDALSGASAIHQRLPARMKSVN